MPRRCRRKGTAIAWLAAAAVALAAGPLAWGLEIGLVVPQGTPGGQEMQARLLAGLQRAGVDTSGIKFLVQQPAADSISLANGVRKLVAYDVGMLVVVGGTAAKEAVKQGVKVPVVFIGSYDPVDQGLVKDLKAPGRNVTGVSSKTSLVLLLDAVQETAAPRSIAALVNADNADGASQARELQSLAGARGISVNVVDPVRGGPEAAAERIAAAQLVYIASGSLSETFGMPELSRLARPLVTQTPDLSGGGLVFSVAPESDTIVDEGAATMARILKGEKPAAVAVSQVRKIEFTVNMAEAGKLGLKVPFPVVSRATRVVK